MNIDSAVVFRYISPLYDHPIVCDWAKIVSKIGRKFAAFCRSHCSKVASAAAAKIFVSRKCWKFSNMYLVEWGTISQRSVVVDMTLAVNQMTKMNSPTTCIVPLQPHWKTFIIDKMSQGEWQKTKCTAQPTRLTIIVYSKITVWYWDYSL